MEILRLSESVSLKLARAVEQSPATVVITDLEGRIEYVNPKFTETTGYTLNEALGQNPRILKSGETASEEYKHLWETIVSGHEWRGEFHNKRKDGTLYWEFASISPIRDIDGQITHFLAVKENITQAKEAAEKLKETMRELEQVNRLMMGREERVLELKGEVNELLQTAGLPPKYRITS